MKSGPADQAPNGKEDTGVASGPSDEKRPSVAESVTQRPLSGTASLPISRAAARIAAMFVRDQNKRYRALNRPTEEKIRRSLLRPALNDAVSVRGRIAGVIQFSGPEPAEWPSR